MRKRLLISLCLFLAIHSLAQRNCGTVGYQQMLEQQDPSVLQQKIAIENFTQQFIANDEGGDRAVLTIPVVVHVVWNTATENISEAQILSQLDVLNEDFRKMNADVSSVPGVFQPLASDVEIEFCLATIDPNGNPTTGITRTNTSLTSFPYPGNAMKFDAQGGKDAWPRDSYLNMWVCDLAAGLLGFAQFPGGGASTDGVVIDYLYFGNTGTATAPYDLGRTATHEVGHWLNLYHIWGDDDDCSGSDLVADTPNQEVDNGGCPTFPHVTCSNGPNGDMFMNYMDYTNDACMFMFSAGQTTRMRALFASGGFREPLLSSMGCGIPPACSAPTGLAASGITQTGATVSWTAVTEATSGYQYVVSTSSSTPSGSGTATTLTSVSAGTLTANTSYYLFVRTNCGVDGFSAWSGPYAFSTPCAAVNSFPFNETFEAASTSRPCWKVNEYVSGTNVDWTYGTGGASGGGSITAAHGGTVNARFYKADNSSSSVTRLVSPPLNLSSLTSPELSFWYANEAWSGDQDELRVFYKTSSGGTWTQISGATYITSVSSWTEVVLSLPSTSSDYYIAFQGTARYGRGVVVDDVQVRNGSTCAAPASLTATAASGTTANIGWGSVAGASGGYEYVVSTSNSAPSGAGTSFAGISTTIGSLNAGTTYYLFVRSNCGSGNFSSWSGPQGFTTPIANDNCSGAIILTPALSCNPVAGTTVGATQSIPAITCATFTGNANDDVWYSFTAVSPNHTVVVDGDTGFDAVVDVRSGSCNGSNIACADATTGGGVEQVALSSLSNNTTYYVRIYGFGNAASNGGFTICVTMPAAVTWYLDFDGDGRYVSTQQAYFSPGTGWSTTAGISGDCNDNNIAVWQSASLYIDNDSDGYNAGTQTVCYGVSIPAGYSSTTSGADCNDNNNAIRPNATEVCDGVDNNCNGSTDEGLTTTFYLDNDNDGYGNNSSTTQACSIPVGYASIGGDCNDNNNAIRPGATEVCDGVDNNCNGSTDEGVTTTYYLDSDSDGYGSNASTTQACSLPLGYAAVGGDCNNNNNAIYPGATELCDGTDNNCNGSTDEGVTTTYYLDSDGDGYGSNASTTQACSLPVGYATVGGDCNNNNNTIHPGATELCNGLDDDCDGSTDESITMQNYYADNDGDGYGSTALLGSFCSPPLSSSLNNTDCNDGNISVWQSASLYVDNDGDGYNAGTQTVCYGASIPVGFSSTTSGIDCNDNNNAIRPGATEVCDGIDNNCNGSTDEGVTTTYYLDSDGDGYGSNASTTQACSLPAGYAALGGDCNNNNNTIHPGATELCNGLDDDCDGSTDESITMQNYYADIDGDGYGSTTLLGSFCSPPSNSSINNTDCNDGNISVWQSALLYIDNDSDGYNVGTQTVCYGASIPAGFSSTTSGIDCNDNNSAIRPGATELCDGLDNNCNGSTDEGVTTTYYLDSDGDGYGSNASTTQVCSLPVGYAAVGGDCNNNNNAIRPGVSELCDGIDNNCDGQTDEGCGVSTNPPANDNFALNNPNVSAVAYVYPNCINILGSTAGATVSPYTGEKEVWYKFVAQSNGVSIEVNSSIINPKIYLFRSNNPSVIVDEEDLTEGGTEVLNYGGLVEGQSYHIAIASVGDADGAFSFCVKRLRKPACTQPPSGGYTLCSLFMSSTTGAATTTFSFTNAQNQTTSLTSVGPVALGNPLLHLYYGDTLSTNLVANYVLFDALGNQEPISVASAAPCVVHIRNHPLAEVKSNLRCSNGAILYRSSYLLATFVSGPVVCGATGYIVEFTPVGNCTGDNSQSQETFTKTISSASPCISLSYAFNQIPLSTNLGLGYWSVRWKPRFGSVEGEYGNAHVIAVNGTAPLNAMMNYDDETNLVSIGKASSVEANIYPNPNNGDGVNLQITGIETDEVFLGVIDGLGRRIYNNRFSAEETLNTSITFDQPLSGGLYLVEIIIGNETIRKRMIIVR